MFEKSNSFNNRQRRITMSTIQELIQQREQIEAQIAEMRKAEKAAAIQQAKALVDQFQLTSEDIFSNSKVGKAIKVKRQRVSGYKVAVKYRDPATGATWAGRGLMPHWLRGKNKDDFKVAA
jgi:DNA-binding protein H-NS